MKKFLKEFLKGIAFSPVFSICLFLLIVGIILENFGLTIDWLDAEGEEEEGQ